jgi:hypothetical protein
MTDALILRRARRGRSVQLAALASAVAALPGCDPVIDIEGAYFPAWLLCVIVGIVLAVLSRYVFVWLKIERHMGPLPLVYSCLALFLALVTWMVFFHT